jgi:imidazolonepropionase
MQLLNNISILYTCRDEGGQGDLYPVENAAVVWEDDIIQWVGRESDLPEIYTDYSSLSAHGNIVIPGLVDCHTHLCFGGWRAEEFEMRIQGKSYLDIAKEGGGILSTVRGTRETSEDALYNKASKLLEEIMKGGVATIECKSGYGLTLEDELKQLRVYKKLNENYPVHLVSTFLGAHTYPPEFKNNHEEYIQLLVNEMIPAVAEEKLADFCDVFVEDSAFSADEARRILEEAKKYGLRPKIHADQLTSCGGAELAAETGAISADHLEQVSDKGIRKMAETGVIGVTLPIASLYTQQPYLNCRKLVDQNVQVAVATDFNPGSAPSFHLPLAMMLACNHGRLTPSEALKAATIYGAKAIGADRKSGSIEKGKAANMLVLNAPSINFWLYHFNPNSILSVYLNGRLYN